MLARHLRGLSSGCDIEFAYDSNEANANLYSKAVTAGWTEGCNVFCTINSGINLYSENSNPGLTISHTGTDMGWPAGTEITINNLGNIYGSTGSAGGAGTSSGQAGSAGGTGGTALKIKKTDASGTLDGVSIFFTNNGNMKGGGGGGGGGGCGTDYQSSYTCTDYYPSTSWTNNGTNQNYNFIWWYSNASLFNRYTAWCNSSWISCTPCSGDTDANGGCDNCSCADGCFSSTPSTVSYGACTGGGSHTYDWYTNGAAQTNHTFKHNFCTRTAYVRGQYDDTCYTSHTHGDGGNGGAGGDWNSGAVGGSGGNGGSPNGNGTEDGGAGATGGELGLAGGTGSSGGGGSNGGASGGAGYYVNYGAGNTSGWSFTNNGTVGGQIG